MAKALNLFSYRNKITNPMLYFHVHHCFSHSINNLSMHWWINGLKNTIHTYANAYTQNGIFSHKIMEILPYVTAWIGNGVM